MVVTGLVPGYCHEASFVERLNVFCGSESKHCRFFVEKKGEILHHANVDTYVCVYFVCLLFLGGVNDPHA